MDKGRTLIKTNRVISCLLPKMNKLTTMMTTSWIAMTTQTSLISSNPMIKSTMTASKRLLTNNTSTIPTTPKGACLGTGRRGRIQIRREYLKITSYCVKIPLGKNLQSPSQPSTTLPQRRTQVRNSTLRTSFLAKSIIPIFWKSKTSSPYLSGELITIAMVTNSMGDFKTSIWVKIVSCLTTYLLGEFTRCKL